MQQLYPLLHEMEENSILKFKLQESKKAMNLSLRAIFKKSLRGISTHHNTQT